MANLARVAPTGTGEFSASRERETKREKEIERWKRCTRDEEHKLSGRISGGLGGGSKDGNGISMS